MILVTIWHECHTSACAVYIRDVRVAMTLKKLTYIQLPKWLAPDVPRT